MGTGDIWISQRVRTQGSEVTDISCKHVGECYSVCVWVLVNQTVVDVVVCNLPQAYINSCPGI